MKRELWERGFSPFSRKEEVKRARLRRKTKAQLIGKIKGGQQGMSPRLDTEVREGADDVSEGVVYEVVNVEEINTDVQHLSGIRVSLKDAKGGEGNVMLWKRKITGTGSKLGVFITLLGHDTDKWMHKWIKFVTWQDRKRELELISAPAPAKTKPPKGKTA